MNKALAFSWIMIFALNTLATADEREWEFDNGSFHPLVLGSVSFLSEPEPMELIRIHQARETLDLVTRLKGFDPLYPFWQSRQMFDFQPVNDFRLRPAANFPEDTSHLNPIYKEGTVEFEFKHYLYLLGVPFDLYQDKEEFLDYAWEKENQVATLLTASTTERLRIWEDMLETFGISCDAGLLTLDSDFSKDSWAPGDYSERPYWERNALMSDLRVTVFESGLLEGSIEGVGLQLVELARLNIIQAIYLARFDQVGSARHLGRTLLYADMLLWANPESSFAQDLFDEVDSLASRFSGESKLNAIEDPLLPETALLLAHDAAPLTEETKEYPAIESLLDYMMCVEVQADRVGRETAINRYIHKGDSGVKFLEALLLAQKDTFNTGMTFNGYMWLTNVSRGIYRQHGIGLCQISLQLILESLGETTSDLVDTDDIEYGYPDLLGPHASSVLNGISYNDLALPWSELAPLKSFEKNLAWRERLFDTSFEIEPEEIYWEIRSTHIFYVKAIKGRMRTVGAKKSESEIKSLLSAYGLKGMRLDSGLVWSKGFYPDGRSKSRFQEDLDTMANDAKTAYFRGDLEEAVRIFRILVPMVGSSDSDLMNIAFYAFLKGGYSEEGVSLVMQQFSSGFGKDKFRLLLLALAPEVLETYPEYLYQSNTASANDYFAQAEALFRLGRYDDVLDVCERYHYGESKRISLLRTLAQWLNSGTPPSDMEMLKTQLTNALDDYGSPTVSFLDAWVNVLDEQLEDDPTWAAYKEEMDVDSISAVMRAEKALYRKLTEPQLKSVYEDLREVTNSFTNKDYDLSWKHYALQYEHFALGELLNLRTNGFTTGLAEARSEVVDLMDKTLRTMDGRSSMLAEKYQPHPLETGWLHAAVKAGANPMALSRFVNTIPDPEFYFQGEGLLFVECVPYANMLAEIFRNAPHQNSTSNYWASPFDPEAENLLPVARESVIPDLVMTCSFALFDETNDFSKLVPLFESREQAVHWIENNAPNSATGKRWIEAFDNAEGVNTYPLDIPPYYRYLTAKDRLAFSRN